MKRIAVVSAILDKPEQSQRELNELVSSFKGLIKGRIGLPMPEHEVTVISITLVGDLDEINTLTGKIGLIDGVQVKTSISKKGI